MKNPLRYSKLFINALLLLCTPALVAYPQSNIPIVHEYKQSICEQANEILDRLQNYQLVTYDELLGWLERFEKEDTDYEDCSPQDILRINNFLAYLARLGTLPTATEEEKAQLESDIEELLNSDTDSNGDIEFEGAAYFPYQMGKYAIVPAVFYGQRDIVLCKNWFKKKWKQGKEFFKEHKVGCILATAAIVIVTVVVCVAAAPAAGAVAAAVAGAEASSPSPSENHNRPPIQNEKTLPPQENSQLDKSVALEQELSALKDVFDEHLSSFKGKVSDDLFLNPKNEIVPKDRAVSEVAREFASQCAHETFDYIADSAVVLPLIGEGIQKLGNKVSPDMMATLIGADNRNLMEKYKADVAEGHQTIDKIFSTDQAGSYASEVKENPANPKNHMTIGILPPPAGVFGEGGAAAKEVVKDVSAGGKEIAIASKTLKAVDQATGLTKEISINVDKLSEAGKVIDRGGLTKAGRGLMKHGYREGSVFPKPIGNPIQVNKEGQVILEKILNDPNKKIYHLADGSLKIYSSDGQGAFFKQDGSFRGFIEQQYE